MPKPSETAMEAAVRWNVRCRGTKMDALTLADIIDEAYAPLRKSATVIYRDSSDEQFTVMREAVASATPKE